MAEIIIAKHRNGAVEDVALRFLKDQARFADKNSDENSTAATPMGKTQKYSYVQSAIGSDDGGQGGFAGGLSSAGGGGEFDIAPTPSRTYTNPADDEAPF
jgi:replicative DNA helicase